MEKFPAQHTTLAFAVDDLALSLSLSVCTLYTYIRFGAGRLMKSDGNRCRSYFLLSLCNWNI